ncbi:MAG: hypothetical protein NVS3B8_00160 [Chitinophagaceae bacterium]
MDNTYQLNAAALFNLKGYGLVVYLLNNGVKIKWAIRSGKVKDGIDFTANVQQVQPSLTGSPFSADFKGGSFVIAAPDLAGVDSLISAYYSANGLTGNDRPNVYQTTVSITIDIRYDLTGFLPKAAILTDGGNQGIHLAFMNAAGMPSINFTTSTGSNLSASCFTFASEPHNSNTGTTVDAAITNIRNFVLSGGNFLAECAAVPNYENNSLGRFQTTTGITVSNTAIGTSGNYPNPDLSYSQFEGIYNGSLSGSVKNWKINGSGINNEHNHYTGSGAAATSISASVSKLKSGLGGLVFYLGNHNFSTADLQNINGIRMYMNAFLTPAYTVCGSLLPVKLIHFTANNVTHKAKLEWSVGGNETVEAVEIERSDNGSSFSVVIAIANTGKSGEESYTYTAQTILSHAAYFRLKIINKNGYHFYSKTILVKPDEVKAGDSFTILLNPFIVAINFNYTTTGGGIKEVSLYNILGKKIFSNSVMTYEGSRNYTVIPGQEIPAGMYFLELNDSKQRIIKELIKQ